MDERARVTQCAEAVADGDPLDWAEAEAGARDDDARALIANLRAVASIGDLFGTVGATSRTPRAEGPALRAGAAWGPLRIITHIGRGTFGDVYRAADPTLDRDVALKLLRREEDDSSVDTQVIEEGRLMARVRHPNVVTIHGAQRIDGVTGLWMEFVDGRTLAAELAERGPFSARDLIDVGLALARALAAVHDAGLLHRDIKAQNVMRERGGRIVLGDFGTGHELEETTERPSGLEGTPAYLAPEIFEGSAASPQSDLYSLGVLLFHLATGRYPLEGRSLRALRDAHGRGQRLALASLRPDLPSELTRLIERAIDPNPELRFAGAAEIVRDLERVRAAPQHQRRRWQQGLVLAATLTLVGAAVVAGALWARRATHHGLALTEIDLDFQRRVTIRAPSANPRLATCSAWGQQTVALCDLVKREMRALRVPRTSDEWASSDQFLSPDGRTIAYIWNQFDGHETHSSFRLIGADGDNDREMPRVSPGRVLRLLQWTRDGRAVAAVIGTQIDRRVVLLSASGDQDQELWRLSEEARWPNLSPDERFLAFIRGVPGLPTRDVVIGDRQTGRVTAVTSNRLDDARPVFTDDGRGLVFVSDRSGSRALYLQRLDNGQPIGEAVLLHDLGRSDIWPLGIAGDGTIFFAITQDSFDVYRATLDLDRLEIREPERIEAHSIDDSAGADWSPEGNRFAYASGCVFRVTSCENRLRIRTSEGRVEHDFSLLPTMLPRGTRVRWAPDGNRIALVYDIPVQTGTGTTTVIDLVDVRNGNTRRLTEARDVNDIHWNPSGTALYSLTRRQISRIDAVTGEASVFYRGADLAGLVKACSFDVSRTDGSLLLMARKPSNELVIRVVHPDGSTTDRAMLKSICLSLAWTVDARTILYSVNTGPGTPFNLWAMPADSGDARQLRSSVADIGDIAIHPDGRQMLFTAGNPPTYVWTLSGLPR